MFEAYFDRDGLLHDSTNITPSENRSLWLVEAVMLYHRQHDKDIGWIDQLDANEAQRNIEKLFDGKTWHALPNPEEFKNDGFSRDNMIAVTSFGMRFSVEKFKKAGWNMMPYRRYLQPQDVIWFGYCAGKTWARILLPFLVLNMLWSCGKMSKTRGGSLDTDGIILSWMRLESGYRHSKLLAWTKGYIEKHLPRNLQSYFDHCDDNGEFRKIATIPYCHCWRVAFRLYFNDKNHPINILAEKVWPNNARPVKTL